jgi:hypothetical protein
MKFDAINDPFKDEIEIDKLLTQFEYTDDRKMNETLLDPYNPFEKKVNKELTSIGVDLSLSEIDRSKLDTLQTFDKIKKEREEAGIVDSETSERVNNYVENTFTQLDVGTKANVKQSLVNLEEEMVRDRNSYQDSIWKVYEGFLLAESPKRFGGESLDDTSFENSWFQCIAGGQTPEQCVVSTGWTEDMISIINPVDYYDWNNPDTAADIGGEIDEAFCDSPWWWTKEVCR